MPKIDQDGSEALALLREPYLGRINQIPNQNSADAKEHIVDIVGTSKLLGVDDFGVDQVPTYMTTAVVISQTAELFMIDKDIFQSIFKQTPAWNDLLKKSRDELANSRRSIKMMKLSNFSIIDGLKHYTEESEGGQNKITAKLVSLLDEISKNVQD